MQLIKGIVGIVVPEFSRDSEKSQGILMEIDLGVSIGEERVIPCH